MKPVSLLLESFQVRRIWVVEIPLADRPVGEPGGGSGVGEEVAVGRGVEVEEGVGVGRGGEGGGWWGGGGGGGGGGASGLGRKRPGR